MSSFDEDAVPFRKRAQEEREVRFREESREAVESYNRFIAEHGIWSKKYRSW